MPEIMLYNTATRRKERFEPLDPDNVRMYVCGPTVYDRAHIGNARPAVVFDVLFRLLRHEYGAEHVTYVRNITDVDDKINARAAATKGEGDSELNAIRRITDETVGWYHEDMAAIGNLAPTHEPRATGYIVQMVAMIEVLIARGNAYAAEGHVLFEVAKDPKYGSFANRNLEEMRAGARVEVAPYKRDPMDFVLWKPSDEATPGWDSPWGRGRPGWHIECSAMARELLGESFDIHGGGIDLAFPHHENEIAQSRCAHPEGEFAKIWMHNGFLQVEGEKMSKSLGNFFTVRDLLDCGVPGDVMRFVLLSTHYRQPLDWTERKLEEATNIIRKWWSFCDEANSETPSEELCDAIKDDLNFPKAIAVLHRLASSDWDGLYAAGRLMGFNMRNPDPIPLEFETDASAALGRLIMLRTAFRDERNFEDADRIRTDLKEIGWLVVDGTELPSAVGEPTAEKWGPAGATKAEKWSWREDRTVEIAEKWRAW